jgi:putative aldouronate transport system permease protein
MKRLIFDLKRGFPFYILILPGFLYFIIFKYLPMVGLLMAFQQYDPFVGIWDSQWIGLDHFFRLFSENDFYLLLKNTLIISFLNLFFYFPAPILAAILLNEVGRAAFRKSVQTIIYIPHFLSWVVIVGITALLLGTQDGGINTWLDTNGFERIRFMTDPEFFRPMFVLQNIWKEAGWHAIIFLATLASVDPTLYEAAVVDGASRWRQMWHITFPALKTITIILFILRIGDVLDTGFQHVYLLQNALNMNVSDVFDTYVYRIGILGGQFSYTIAIGFFKSVVGLILVIGANKLAKKMGEEGVY